MRVALIGWIWAATVLVTGPRVWGQGATTAEPGVRATSQSETPQEERATTILLDVRATSLGGGTRVGIDRGTTDGVAVGDRVTFRPRGGRVLRGKVVKAFDRWSSIQMPVDSVIPEPGARGQVRVPVRRLERLGLMPVAGPPVEPEPLPDPAPTGEPEPDVAEVPADPPSWEETDEGWTPDMPLLTPMQVQHPSLRDPRMSGRVYMVGTYFGTDEAGRSDAVGRAGISLFVENPVHRGGVLQFDAEVDYRRAEIPTAGNQDDLYLRLDRLSYRVGGHRFATQSFEFGRFLQRGMPEFGVLDGVEWSVRSEGGDRLGISLGAMPEPDADHDTGDDLQVAAFYSWVDDVDEVLTISAGVQKTLHNGDSDRDLIVTSLHYVPPSGWDLHATAWLDYYGGSEQAQGPGFELTQLLASASRRLDNGGGVDVTLSHFGFPDIDRNEFLPPDVDELAELRNDRLALDGWSPVGPGRTLHGRISGWSDQLDSGGDLEAGLTLDDVLFDDARGDVTLFGTQGNYSLTAGARVSLSREVGQGSWDILYEVAGHDMDGPDSNLAGLVQHRLRAGREFHLARDWYVSLHGEGVVWDDATSWSVGVYVQRSF